MHNRRKIKAKRRVTGLKIYTQVARFHDIRLGKGPTFHARDFYIKVFRVVWHIRQKAAITLNIIDDSC